MDFPICWQRYLTGSRHRSFDIEVLTVKICALRYICDILESEPALGEQKDSSELITGVKRRK